MSRDIWHQTATALDGQVDSAMWKLREGADFTALGSEIERAFAAYFVLCMRVGGVPHVFGREMPADGRRMYFLSPQVEVGKYRVDFVLGWSGKPLLKDCVVIECDGHDWHERTKEQAARDKARDRYLSRQAGRVIHFTGSEIYRNVETCWIEALKTLNILHDVEGADD